MSVRAFSSLRCSGLDGAQWMRRTCRAAAISVATAPKNIQCSRILAVSLGHFTRIQPSTRSFDRGPNKCRGQTFRTLQLTHDASTPGYLQSLSRRAFSTARRTSLQNTLNPGRSGQPKQKHVGDDPSPGQILADRVRLCMRSVAHPVAIITSSELSGTSSEKSTTWRGATVSSFNTVCLEPEPIVSFNIKQLSSTFTAIKESGIFSVHLMRHSPSAVSIASRFAAGNAGQPFHDDDGNVHSWVDMGASVRTPGFVFAYEGEAVLLFRLHCKYLPESSVLVGDHAVVLGAVKRVDTPEDVTVEEDAESLMYVNQGYGIVTKSE